MISVVNFLYSNTLKSLLLDYAVTDMGCFDDYSDAAPRAKIMRRNGITNFCLHLSQCITFHQTIFSTATLISEASLKSFYSRLDFKVIKYFLAYPNFEVAYKRFHYESGKPKTLQKKTIGLQYYLTIPHRVTFIYDNIIDLNENKDLFKDSNEFPPSYDWSPYEYIDAKVKNKVDKTKGQLTGD